MTVVDGVYLMAATFPCCGHSGQFVRSGIRARYLKTCSKCGRKWEVVLADCEIASRFSKPVKKLVWTMTRGPHLVTDKDTLVRARRGKRKK